MSYVIFLYADGLIQWDIYQNYYAHVGINTGDGETFISHEYSLTPQVINIASSRVPADRVMVDGMLVYRVDGQNRTRSCVDSSDGRLWVSAVVTISINYVRPIINRSLILFEYYLPIVQLNSF